MSQPQSISTTQLPLALVYRRSAGGVARLTGCRRRLTSRARLTMGSCSGCWRPPRPPKGDSTDFVAPERNGALYVCLALLLTH
eukprot:scaffold429530_cov53-Prasinocladus_malaysianus.AAC.1